MSAQFSPESKFQIYTFNTEAKAVLDGSDNVWLEVGDGKQVDEAIRKLRRTVPQEGSNMKAAYEVINSLNPAPDNVIVLVDSLPTMDSPEAKRGMVTGAERLRYHYDAIDVIPTGVPDQYSALPDGRRLPGVHRLLAARIPDGRFVHEHQQGLAVVMARKKRAIEAFSLSFLDCICCGFGAIVLLLVLSKIYEPTILEKTNEDLQQLIAKLQEELFDIRGETEVMNRALGKVQLETSETKMRLTHVTKRAQHCSGPVRPD